MFSIGEIDCGVFERCMSEVYHQCNLLYNTNTTMVIAKYLKHDKRECIYLSISGEELNEKTGDCIILSRINDNYIVSVHNRSNNLGLSRVLSSEAVEYILKERK